MEKILIVPSILAADFACLGAEIDKVISSGIKMIHFDMMDNHYVPSLGVGPIVLKSLRSSGIDIFIDVHLMAKPVDCLILDCVSAGANSISIHPETTNHIDRSLELIKENGCKVGLVFNPTTPLYYLEYVINKLDLILLMSVNPGFAGQSFLPFVLNKVSQVRNLIEKSGCNIRLAVDGGINTNNISLIARAGADMFIVGTAIFSKFDYQQAINDLYCKLQN
ncbi:ribulose-phosphate 3-epimerase [Blochmannia endosymbiont of Camponotus (Colobopsis) obliquus]|uniref:ribulose-phosphate 3-epimerase n=1 Tax=Blochmannia endosymbiont of Camponotus (Colobopsis) obliquus TaxID=1505597 RepID=UPI00061A86D0|nr:ribulose-phosphate 3-epimerase [Blochmannia endosymbiont of Camponotus (Colobopsis) obliquus]AKC60715.1 ribulose-phosphate 3-epimerase [Blochmannia endosymbiont of Camponotus (Colobopsis) obliquus]